MNEAFYWDLDDGTRAFASRFMARHHAPLDYPGRRLLGHAALSEVGGAAGTTDTAAVMAKMHELPIDDPTVRHATLRRDGA